MLSTNLFPHSDACLLAIAKYLSRLIITFYKKSTINITDLINKYDWVWASKISELATGLVEVKLVLERQIKEKNQIKLIMTETNKL